MRGEPPTNTLSRQLIARELQVCSLPEEQGNGQLKMENKKARCLNESTIR
jgi:hypothetical protein